jgi:hypothetical protein
MRDINFFDSLQRLYRDYQENIEISCPNVADEEV